MKTTALKDEANVIAPYVSRVMAAEQRLQELTSTLDAMLTLVYPAWKPGVCKYRDGVIYDSRD